MQRVLVIAAVILLVTTSLCVGALAAHWPFWQRAWTWHASAGAWPASMSGPRATVHGGTGTALVFQAADEQLATLARSADTRVLLRVRDGSADGWSAAGSSPGQLIDGRGLAVAVLPPLFEALSQRVPGLLDRPVGAWLDELQLDARGALTPRDLLGEVGGGLMSPAVAGRALNPFRATARLASGPGFRSAAIALFDPADPSRRATRKAAAGQVLAEVAAAAAGDSFARTLEQDLWVRVAGSDASLLLDRRRGTAAVHCCMIAAAADWLRLGVAVGDAGSILRDGWREVRTTGRVLLAAPGRAVLWVGEGEPPIGLETLITDPAGAPP